MSYKEIQIVASLPDIVIDELITIQEEFKGYQNKSIDYIISSAISEFYYYHRPDYIEEDCR